MPCTQQIINILPCSCDNCLSNPENTNGCLYKNLREIKAYTVKSKITAQDEGDDDTFGIKGLKVSELKEYLRERKLSLVGLKPVLYKRLKEHMENEGNNNEELAEQDEDCEEEEGESESESSESSESESESD